MNLTDMMKPGMGRPDEGKGDEMDAMMVAKIEAALKKKGIIADDDDLMDLLGWQDGVPMDEQDEEQEQEPDQDEPRGLLAGHPAAA